MPTFKVRGDKITVCCGDDCVEIDTSEGGGSELPHKPPPISGGAAIYEPIRLITERLVLGADAGWSDFASQVNNISNKPSVDFADTELTVQLIVPRGSTLRLSVLRSLADRFKANVEVRFAAM